MRATHVLAFTAVAMVIGQLAAFAQHNAPSVVPAAGYGQSTAAPVTPASAQSAKRTDKFQVEVTPVAGLPDTPAGQPRTASGVGHGTSGEAAIGAETSGEGADALSGRTVFGALMLCGGGPLPNTLLETFFEMGQASRGTLVIIPSASSQADTGDFTPMVSAWQKFPWASVRVLHARDRDQVEDDDEFAQPLRDATAVWISGGDQRRLAERYLGTRVERELKNVVDRGGVIGGTSAGSAIASRVMISGGRQQPVIADGLDLLPGTIIDQHFSQRRRYDRLASTVQQHPDRVGIGIDESTGLVISQQKARVLGAGSVYVYQPDMRTSGSSEPLRFDSGSNFELRDYIQD